MDLSWLRTFVTAAKYGNFRKAAEELHLAQPTVSVQIQKLESFWEVELFEHVGRNIQLSKAGKRFLRHAQKIISNYDESVQDMARWREGYEHVVTVAVSPIIATTFLPRWIRGFTELRPEVTFIVHVVDSEQIAPDVLVRDADVGFSRMQTVDPRLDCKVVYDDPLVLVAPRDAQDFEGTPRLAEDVLRQYTLFTHNHPGYWDELLGQLRIHLQSVHTMEVNQVHVCLDWILEGLGISFLPRSTIRRALRAGAVEEIPFHLFLLPTTYTYIVTHRNDSKIVEDFVTYVAEYMTIRPLG